MQHRLASAAIGALLVFSPVPLQAARELRIRLRFTPKENVTANLPKLEGVSSGRAIEALPLVDVRALSDRSFVGENREHKTPRPVRATSSVAGFATAVLKQCLGEWGVRLEKGDLILRGEITNLFVTEDQTYSTAVSMRFRLEEPASNKALWEGIVTGDAHQWGRSFEEENYNEEISDALKRTYANLVSNAGFQNAWVGTPASDIPAFSPAELKAKILDMTKSGISEETIVSYVRSTKLVRPLNADEILDWKKAGIAEAVIRGALAERR